jgi:Type IV pilin-like G and H, putative
MKFNILTLTTLTFLLGFISHSEVRAKKPVQLNKAISTQNIQIKKDIQTYLGSLSRAQQAYYLENNKFTTKIKDLGLGIDVNNTFKNYRWQVLTDKNAQQTVMTVLAPKTRGKKTYLSLVQVSRVSGEGITLATVCESQKNQFTVPKLPSKIKSNQIQCPSGFKEFKISGDEEALLEQDEKEQGLKFGVAGFNALQQQYHSINKSFANQTQQLFGFNLDKEMQEQGIKLEIIPVDSINGIATVVSAPGKPYRSYIGIVKSNLNNTESIICESQVNQAITSAQLVSLSTSQFRCPDNLKLISLNSEEKSKIDSSVNDFVKEFQKNQDILSEINQPRKISTLVEAEELAKKGDNINALKKYRQSLSAIGLNDMTIHSLENLGSESLKNPLLVKIREAFLKKVAPILTASEPQINQEYQAIEEEISSFLNKYRSNKNQTAREVNQFAATQFGLDLISDSKNKSSLSVAKIQEVAKITPSLRNFFEQASEKPEKLNRRLPQHVRQYLLKNQDNIANLSNLLINNEIAEWEFDVDMIKRGDINEAVPSFLGYVALQDILLGDVIDKHQKGQTKAMLKSLEASWKLSESLKNQPLLIGQLVNIITSRKQTQVIRHINNVPSHWQQRLTNLNLNESLMAALQSEVFFGFTSINRDANFPNMSAETKNYRRWESIDFYRTTQEVYNLVRQQDNFCQLDVKALATKYFEQKGYKDVGYQTLMLGQLNKANHLMLEAEMTEKVLLIKSNKNKSLQTSMNSNICSGSNWVYKKLPNGKWSISLDTQPVWKSNTFKIPLTYTQN